MCRVWTMTYLCNHTQPFRLSTCLGQCTLQPQSNSASSSSFPTPSSLKPSCASPTSLAFTSSQCCGPCSYEEAAQTLKEDHAHRRARLAVRAARRASRAAEDGPHQPQYPHATQPHPAPHTPEDDDAQAALDDEFATRLWQLEQAYPYRDAAPGAAAPVRRPVRVVKRLAGSLLKVEVAPEDVVVDEGAGQGWADAAVDAEVADAEGEVEDGKEAEATTDGTVESTDGSGVDTDDDPAEHARAEPIGKKLIAGIKHSRKAVSTTPATTFTILSRLGTRDGRGGKDEPSMLGAVLDTYRLPTLVELTIT